MAKSKKTAVVEYLFNQLWDEESRSLERTLVTLNDLQAAINHINSLAADESDKLSTRNPANFIKDFIRNRESANRNFPKSVADSGFTLRQLTGENKAFEFIPYVEGQIAPFPEEQLVEREQNQLHLIETVSLPLTSRRLGRRDEPWLIQILVRLRVLETHFSIYSPLNVLQLDHLQMGIKLRRAEIDGLFLAVVDLQTPKERPEKLQNTQEMIITCEAKGVRDDILPDQLVRQVRAVFQQPAITQNFVIPVAVKAIGPSLVRFVEYDKVERNDCTGSEVTLKAVKDINYRFVPPIPGIGT